MLPMCPCPFTFLHLLFPADISGGFLADLDEDWGWIFDRSFCSRHFQFLIVSVSLFLSLFLKYNFPTLPSPPSPSICRAIVVVKFVYLGWKTLLHFAGPFGFISKDYGNVADVSFLPPLANSLADSAGSGCHFLVSFSFSLSISSRFASGLIESEHGPFSAVRYSGGISAGVTSPHPERFSFPPAWFIYHN